MSESSHQSDFFSTHALQRHDLGDAELLEYRDIFNIEDSISYFDLLHKKVNWKSASIRIAGRNVPIPRLQCWVADRGLTYRYSGMTMSPEPWSEVLREIRSRVEQLAELRFNAVLLNLYRDGRDSVAWHADDEPELGENPVVASLSLGANRPFELKHRTRDVRLRMTLHNNSLLIMGETLQNNWLHQLPKVNSSIGPRINLTFRKLQTRD